MIRWRGKYSDSETYSRYDVVMFDHPILGMGSFICDPFYPNPNELNFDFQCKGNKPDAGDTIWRPYAIQGQEKREDFTSSTSLDGGTISFYRNGKLEGTYLLSEIPIKGSTAKINDHEVEAK